MTFDRKATARSGREQEGWVPSHGVPRVVRICPNEASLIRLTTALAVERDEQWPLAKRYKATYVPTRGPRYIASPGGWRAAVQHICEAMIE